MFGEIPYLCKMFVKCKTLERFFAWGCLLVGMGIYLLFRSRGHLGFVMLDFIGVGEAVGTVRTLVDGAEVSEFVRFSLPDGLWTMSYVLFSDSMNRSDNMKKRMMWVSVVPLLGVVSELMQLVRLIPGTFDIADMASYSVPLLIWGALARLEVHFREKTIE